MSPNLLRMGPTIPVPIADNVVPAIPQPLARAAPVKLDPTPFEPTRSSNRWAVVVVVVAGFLLVGVVVLLAIGLFVAGSGDTAGPPITTVAESDAMFPEASMAVYVTV